MKCLVLLIVILNFGDGKKRSRSSVVPATTGWVVGKIQSTVNSVKYSSFRGIRYANPPIEKLRFMPPVPADPTPGIFMAMKEGNVCPQLSSKMTVIGAEDCLFLNIFTPETKLTEKPTVLKPVIVWFHGGSFTSGSGNVNIRRPDFFIERDVVFVTMNYRLGVLGFLNLGHPRATGNQGLKDQKLALEWVHSNIANFGGNPKNVTIMGISSGAASTGFHVISTASEGLFHGVICMSGTTLAPWAYSTQKQSTEQGIAVARRLGTLWPFFLIKETCLDTLLEATVEKLVHAAMQIDPEVPFKPTLEDNDIATNPFFSKCPLKLYRSGKYNKVPHLVGSMGQETLSYTAYLNGFMDISNKLMTIFKKKAIAGPSSFMKSAILWLSDVIDKLEQLVVKAAVKVTSDYYFNVPMDHFVRLVSKNMDHIPVYYYFNTFHTTKTLYNSASLNRYKGPAHGDDLAYIFYMPSANYNLSLSDPIGLTIHRVITMWTNFAKYGNPTPSWIKEYPLNVTWPIAGMDGKALQIDHQLKVRPRAISKMMETISQAIELLFADSLDC